MGVHQAYRLAGEADTLVGQGRHDEAAGLYRQASALVPDNHELRLWAGLGAAQGGDMPLAVAEVRAAIAAHPAWLELLERLPPDVAPSASAVLAALDGDPP
jgi:tetratricopeptide repeat protein